MHDHDGHIDTSGREASSISRLRKSRGAQGGVVKLTGFNIMTRPAGDSFTLIGAYAAGANGPWIR